MKTETTHSYSRLTILDSSIEYQYRDNIAQQRDVYTPVLVC